MAEASIQVDLLNPGQVFACLGFLEAAETLLGNAHVGFDWSDEANIRFRLSAGGNDNPVETVLAFLAESSVGSVAPAGTELTTDSWDVATSRLAADSPFPFPLPDSPATLPAVFYGAQTDGVQITVDH